MKAVFVIDDIPNELDDNNLLIDYCVHTKGEYKPIRKGGNHPLKPLPQKRINKDCLVVHEIWNEGYNACLDDIIGETE